MRLSMRRNNSRRRFIERLLLAASATIIAGCDRLSRSSWAPKILRTGELANRGTQRALTGKRGLAQEFSEADLSPEFRSNGTANPEDDDYQRSAAAGFSDWKLRVDGLVETATELSLGQLRSMKSRTQITRH